MAPRGVAPLLDDACRFDQLRHGPGLRLRQRTGFLDFNEVALVVRVRLVMRVVLLRLHDVLAVDRVLDATLDQDGDRLVHLVADDLADQRPLKRGFHAFVHFWFAFSVRTVRTRAMSRRTFFSWLVLVSCWVASCMRRPNCAFNRSDSSLLSAALSFW